MVELFLPTDATEQLPVVNEHQAVEFCVAAADAWLTLTVDGQPLAAFLHPGERIWRWRWNPGAAVGLHTVVLAADEEQHSWHLRVEPRKIDQQRYTALLDDLQQLGRSLVYTLGAASSEGASHSHEQAETTDFLESYYALIEGQLPAFVRAVERIAPRPRETLGREPMRQPLGLAAGIDAAALNNIARGTLDPAPPGVASELQAALRPAGGLLPREIATTQAWPDYDIYEHRLLKHTLGLLLRRVRTIGELAGRENREPKTQNPEPRTQNLETRTGRAARLNQIAEGCRQAERQLRQLQALPFLGAVAALPHVHGATPLLQRDQHYRTVYHVWQALRQQSLLEFDSPLFSIPISELPYLYEAWCALQVATALLQLGGTVRQQRLLAPSTASNEPSFATLNLAEDQPLLVIERGGAVLTLRYQPRYRPGRQGDRETGRQGNTEMRLYSLDRHTRVPDVALEVRREGVPPQVLIFDAKYRLDEDGRGVPQDALADAYAYLGAIGCGGQRATLGAVLLYPGKRDEHYASGVGAVALLPGRVDGLAEYLVACGL